jgi:hypothetical protein
VERQVTSPSYIVQSSANVSWAYHFISSSTMSEPASTETMSPLDLTRVMETPAADRTSVRPNAASTADSAADVFQGINNAELLALTQRAIAALYARGLPQLPFTDRQPPPVVPVPPPNLAHSQRQPGMWENAKVKRVICSGLQPLYDGSSNKLIQTLNLIHI